MNKFAGQNVTFSHTPDVTECVGLLKDLYKHAVYVDAPEQNASYATFSAGEKSYDEKNKIANLRMMQVAAEATGVNVGQLNQLNPDMGAFRNESFSDAFFAIIERTIDEVNIRAEVEQALRFAEVHNLADGDSETFHIGSKGIIEFKKDARGKRNAVADKHYYQDVVVSPETRRGTTFVSMYKLNANTEDLGRLVDKIVRGMRSEMHREVINLIFETTSPAANTIYLNSYTQATYQVLIEDLMALNNTSNVLALGTPSALSPVLPDNDNLKFGLGEEVMRQGYVSTQFGIRTMPLMQAARSQDRNNPSRVVPNNHVVLLAMDIDKPVKICMEGRTRSYQSREGETANNTMFRTITTAWAMKVASPVYWGLVKTR